MMLPRIPDLGTVWATFQAVRRRYDDGPTRRVEQRSWAWNILGCAIPVAIFLLLFALVWFLRLGETISHYYGR